MTNDITNNDNSNKVVQIRHADQSSCLCQPSVRFTASGGPFPFGLVLPRGVDSGRRESLRLLVSIGGREMGKLKWVS